MNADVINKLRKATEVLYDHSAEVCLMGKIDVWEFMRAHATMEAAIEKVEEEMRKHELDR